MTLYHLSKQRFFQHICGLNNFFRSSKVVQKKSPSKPIRTTTTTSPKRSPPKEQLPEEFLLIQQPDSTPHSWCRHIWCSNPIAPQDRLYGCRNAQNNQRASCPWNHVIWASCPLQHWDSNRPITYRSPTQQQDRWKDLEISWKSVTRAFVMVDRLAGSGKP